MIPKKLLFIFSFLFLAFCAPIMAQAENLPAPTDFAGWVGVLTAAVTTILLYVGRVWAPLAQIPQKGYIIAGLLIATIVFLVQFGFKETLVYGGAVIGQIIYQLIKSATAPKTQ